MPFRFVYACDLLDELYRIATTDSGPTIIQAVARKRTNDTIIRWFMQHRQRINAFGTDQDAITRTFWVHKAAGRVYGLDPKRLEQIIARALALPTAKWIELQKWELSHRDGDLAACLERVMETTSNTAVQAQANSVTIEEIDRALLLIASRNKRSSPAVRDLAKSSTDLDPIDTLSNIYRRLQAREAKWLTRLILKNYDPIKFPESLDYSIAQSSLPKVLCARIEIQGSATSAVLREGTGMIKGIGCVEAPSDQETPPSPPTTPPEALGESQAGALSSSSQVRRSATPKKISKKDMNLSKPVWQKAIDDVLPSAAVEAQVPPSRPQTRPAEADASLSSPQITPSSNCYNGTGICTLTQKACLISNCIFLLGPCLSDIPWITENLLPWHGCTFTTDPKAFRRSSTLPRRNPKSGARYRKILLIEANRPKQAVKLMKYIAHLNLKRGNGEKEYVEVYDWRLLECVTKVDKGKQLDYNPWKRCWMGAV